MNRGQEAYPIRANEMNIANRFSKNSWNLVYRQTDGRTSVLHIWYKYQVKLDAPHSALTYLWSHLLAAIFIDWWFSSILSIKWTDRLRGEFSIPPFHLRRSRGRIMKLRVRQFYVIWAFNSFWPSYICFMNIHYDTCESVDFQKREWILILFNIYHVNNISINALALCGTNPLEIKGK